MTDLFISYAHKDRERANRIVQLLEEKGYTVWQDVHQIRANERFTKAIMEGIHGGSIFLMLYSNAYFQSQYCDKEFGYAQSCQKTLSCMILDADCPWQGTEFCFPFTQMNVPGYGKTVCSEMDYQALCDQIDESPAFCMLRAHKSSKSTGDTPAFNDHVIVVPEISQFTEISEFYSTAYHEAVHSTGHPKRLNRITDIAQYGSESYSKEELIAELGASYLVHTTGLETKSSFQNSAAYLNGWLSALKGDKRFIISAAGKAETAVQ